jgi:WhiB family redox-sensing transcriptional regulator
MVAQNDWYKDAVCATTDPESFFPEKGGSTKEAKAVCQICKVSTQCLESAIARGEKHGIWGGMSERERRKYRWKKNAA